LLRIVVIVAPGSDKKGTAVHRPVPSFSRGQLDRVQWAKPVPIFRSGPLNSLDSPAAMPVLIEIPTAVAPLFAAAGTPVIFSAPPDGLIPAGHPAQVILEQFGGLKVGFVGTGEECASSDISFGYQEHDQNDAVVLEWQRLLATTLVNIGEVHHSHGALFVDASGACYGMSLVHDAFWFEGGSFGEAVERILLGRKAKPMLRPDQVEVGLYGERFSLGHPNVYRHDQREGSARVIAQPGP
jgi:hypothetical protein